MKKIFFLILLSGSLSIFAQFRQDVYVVADENAQFYKNMPVGSIIYNDSENRAYRLNVSASPTDNLLSVTDKTPYPLSFDGNRAVKRAGLPQVNAGGDNLFEWIENYFFPFINPTISISGNVLYEIGTDNTVSVSGTVTLNDETALTNGHLDRTYPTPVTTVLNFGTSTTYSTTITFNPRQTPTTTDEVTEQRYVSYTTGTDCSCTINSSTKYVRAVYPYLYGLSSLNLETGGTATYTNLTKLIQMQGDKTLTLNGSGYIYFCYPASYPDLTSILDQNGFEQITAFTKYTVNVTSSGLVSDWTESYKIYKLNNTTSATNWSYQFIY